MAKIIVKNNDWDGARAKLQSSLESQQADFNAKMKAAFAPPAAEAKPAAPQTAAPQVSSNARSTYSGRPRSRLA